MDEPTNPAATVDETWSSARVALRVAVRPGTLRRTVVIAAIVGTLLSVVNQADVIARGDTDTTTWIRIAMNYLVPLCVSTAGFLSACRTPT